MQLSINVPDELFLNINESKQNLTQNDIAVIENYDLESELESINTTNNNRWRIL